MSRPRPWLRHPLHRPPPSAAGFALVEVLVAMVVFSFGLLGMVGMQAFALQSNREARLQAQATALGRELAEMMRGNARIAGQTAAANNPYLGAFSVGNLTPSTSSDCLSVGNAATGCSNTRLVAAAQITDWLARVDQTLPGARVTVCFDNAPYDGQGLPQWGCTATASSSVVYIKLGWTQTSTDRIQTGSNAFTMASDGAARPHLVLPVTAGTNL